MKTLFYSIQIRDKNGKQYKTEKGNKVFDFTFEDTTQDETIINMICKSTYNNYKAVCKEGSIIDIEVRYFNVISNTYSLLFSFYGAENKFIKH